MFRIILDTARSILHYIALPISFWGESLLFVTYLINKMPTSKLSWKSPYEILFLGSLLMKFYQPLDVCVLLHLLLIQTNFIPRVEKYVFIGCPQHQKGYKIV